MADKKSWGKTVLGWFVVTDGAPGSPDSLESLTTAGGAGLGAASDAPGDVDALIRKYAQGGGGAGGGEAPVGQGGASVPSAPVELPVQPQGPLPPLGEANVDLEQVYAAFGVDADERDRVNRARDLLRALPQETPGPVKKQIVEASLRSFGIPMEKIIEAAAEELQALEMFNRQGANEAQALLESSSSQIAELEQRIASLRQQMEQAVAAQNGRTAFVNLEKLRVQEVLEFFGQEAVAAVVSASPRLQSPQS